MSAQRAIFMVALTICLSSCRSTNSQQEIKEAEAPISSIQSESEFKQWFAYYYVEKNHHNFYDAMIYMQENKYFIEYPGITSTFISIVFRDNPEEIDKWLTDFEDLNPKSWNIILASLWMSGEENAANRIRMHIKKADPEKQKHFDSLATSGAKTLDFTAYPIKEPKHLNILWSAFSATGDPAYVRRVISLITNYGGEDDISMSSKIAEAALMTLANNTMQHELVAMTCLHEMHSHENPKTRLLLQSMFNAVNSYLEDSDKPQD